MRIVMTGATGLVGQGVLQTALSDARVSAVTVLGRRACGQRHEKLQEVIVRGFDQLDAVGEQLRGMDACLYCAGAPPVGTPEATYRHVTHDLTVNVAKTLLQTNPAMRFLYISGAHANPDSRIMPLRIKGETEVALAALPMRSVMLRPGGIRPVLGERSPHAPLRLLHSIAGPFMGLAMRLMPSMMTDTAHLSRAMLALALADNAPAVVENIDINRWGKA